MNVAEFVAKWRRVELTERSASQQHFLDLCEVFEHPKPAALDPSGEQFTFERGAAKQGGGRGWADVWKRGFFGWEYKGKHKDLDAAYEQLLKYREALENPPLLVVCDMGRIRVHTNFTATVNRTYELTLDELDSTRGVEIMRAVFYDPERLRPAATVANVTTEVAERLGRVAQGLRERGLDPTQVARFLDRIVFCLFAEDVGLLPRQLFSQIVDKSRDPLHFSKLIGQLFDAMAEGGDFGLETIRHFNGNLFIESPALPLTEAEIKHVQAAAKLDWGAVDASIFGTLFERGLDPAKRAQLGAQYTSRADIETLIEPVVIEPLRREWDETRRAVENLLATGRENPTGREKPLTRDAERRAHREARARFRQFYERLSEIKVLDPACGSGNFLYVTLQKMKDLEKEVLVYAGDKGLGSFLPQVNPTQFYGIEINPYAFDLAQTTLWIGYLQWIHSNGFGTPVEPILRRMDNFRNIDAILDLSGEPREPEWPPVDFIVGNPPFLGDKKMRGELGHEYVEALRQLYKGRVPGGADLVAYWFEKARKQIEEGKCKRAGFLATQGIRGGVNREVIKRIKSSGDIFFAESDRDWILDGANVHVSMIGFDDGTDTQKILDGKDVVVINSNLTTEADVTTTRKLTENAGIAFQGPVRVGDFDISFEEEVVGLLYQPNPNGKPNSDVLKPTLNGGDITKRPRGRWVIDFDSMQLKDACLYEVPFRIVEKQVKPLRDASRDKSRKERWWLHGRTGDEIREATGKLRRYLAMAQTAKYFLWQWYDSIVSPEQTVIVFARSDDYFFGILHSRLHEVWALKLGTRLETRPRYTPTTCFETFPFPEATALQQEAIGVAARELDELRQNWLNPKEWTRREILEFPGSIDGAWGRYVEEADGRGIGTVRYPRLVAKDAAAATQLARRTLTNLYNQRPAWLDMAHRRLDEAVFDAYGWKSSISDEEILSSLLELNLRRASPGAGEATVSKVEA